tara:strand:- start:6375 stop:7349 length:975 start_codon:yes stop_codon:yes gene_type:complete
MKILKSLLRVSFGIFLMFFTVYCFIARPLPVTKEESAYSKEISVDNLEKHVYALSETYAPRDANHPLNLKKSGMYIKKELEKHSKDVSLQFFNHGVKSYFNIVGKFGNLESKDIIIVGAHYDGFSKFPGADDNASGVSGVLELAKLLKNKSFNKQIHLVAYSLEEPPFFATKYMGSYIHAQSVKDLNIELMISLEMIGYYSEEENSQDYPMPALKFVYPDKGNFIAIIDQFQNNNAVNLKRIINKYTDLPAYSINAPKQTPGITQSDHRNYWSEDIPALMVTNTAYYRNKNYHTKDDTYDKLDYNKMKSVVLGVFLYLKELDNK